MPWFEDFEATLLLWLVALVVLLMFLGGTRRLHTWLPRAGRGSDRRRRERFKPLSRLRVFKRNTHTYVGQVRDIHHAGMRMHAVQPMSATESLELEISPGAHGDAAQMIPVRARKVWQENDAGDRSIEIGFRFTRLSRSARQAIDALRTVNTDYRQRRHPNVPST